MKFIRNLLVVFTLLVTTSAVAVAQNGEKIKVQGILCEDYSKEPLPFGTVVLSYVSASDTISYRQVCDKDGSFAITLPYAEEYLLSASFIGMETYSKTVKPTAGAKTLNIGKIYLLEEATVLQEATVVASRPLVKSSIDRLSYEMRADPTIKTDNLLDALRKVPLVTIDGEGNIQIKGSGNYKVFLNGKPSNLFNQNAKEVLRAIPAGSIKSVEVITDPGVKYDAEGVSAILNIITDTGRQMEGVTGTVGLNFSSNPIVNANTYLTAKKGKWGVTGNISGYKGRIPLMTGYTERTSGGVTNTQNSTTDMKNMQGYYGSLLLSYEIDSLNLVNVNGTFRSFNNYNLTHIEETLQGVKYTMDNENKMRMGGNEVSIDYQHSTSKPNELLTLSYHFSHTPDSRDIISNRFQAPSLVPLYSRLSTVDGKQIEHTGQIDYTTPIGEHHNIETGVKYIHRSSVSAPTYKYRLDEGRPWIEGGADGSLYSEDFTHTYSIGAAYLAYEYRTMKLSAKAGVRLEAGSLNATFAKKPEANFGKKFVEWVPQVNLSYNLSPTSQLKAGYNFRIQRPSISHLNPYRMPIDEHTVQTGNPNLEAARLHKVNLDYSMYAPKLSLNLSTAYEFTDNAIERYTFREGNVLNTTYGNVGKNRGISFNAYLMYNPTMWLRAFTNLSLQYTHQESQELNLKRNVTSGSGMFGATFMLPKDWNIDVNAGIFKHLVGIQMDTSAHTFSRIGVSKQLLQKRLNINASVNNPFRSHLNFKMTTYGNDFTYTNTTRIASRSFSIGVTYTFGQLKSQVAKTRRTIKNDDLAPTQSNGQTPGQGAM